MGNGDVSAPDASDDDDRDVVIPIYCFAANETEPINNMR